MPAERVLDAVLGGGLCMVAVASAGEARTVLAGLGRPGVEPPRPWGVLPVTGRLSLLVTGVGQANGAGATGAMAPGCAGVLSLGLAGALPGPDAPGVGRVVACGWCVLADSGVETPGGFVTQADLGFPAMEGCGERFACDPAWAAALGPVADAAGGCATVATCSGTDPRAEAIASRTGAVCEDMESAGVALAAARLGLPFACVRVISNRTGDRARQGWDLAGAFSVLARVAGSL